jgi:hypothetical protein
VASNNAPWSWRALHADRGCRKITDDELIALVMACPDLKYIDLE